MINSWILKVARIGVVVMVLGLTQPGCVSNYERGDRAMQVGDSDRALSYYEAAIDEGTRDPELFYKAARAAQQMGAFGKAERYFSQSLRYGGGIDVAYALAEFYVQTSNFNQAVRVFMYLLRVEEEVQPLYSNIGTALMYGGHYLDAESHLLIAQQMDPLDPVPYINLGALYDVHLRNWPRAIRFYECFIEMSKNHQQTRTVRTRLQEMANQRTVDTSRVGLVCGERYQVRQAHQHDLRAILGDDQFVQALEQRQRQSEVIVGGLNLNLPLEYEPRASDAEPIEIVDMEVRYEPESGTQGSSREQSRQDQIAPARRAFEEGRFDVAVEELEELGEEEFGAQERKLYGRSLYRVGRFEEAVTWLKESLQERPSPELAGEVMDALERTGDLAGVEEVCARFGSWPDYEDVLSGCGPR